MAKITEIRVCACDRQVFFYSSLGKVISFCMKTVVDKKAGSRFFILV